MRTLLLPALLFLGACDRVETLIDGSEPLTPREAYANGLRAAGLAETALGRDWLAAGETALRAPVSVTLPVDETGYIASDEPRALAFRVRLVRGRRLVLNVSVTPARSTLVFVDVFRVRGNPLDSLQHVASADRGAALLEFEPRQTADYIVRLQPELLRGGRYRLLLREEPALAFPVEGRGNAAIQSGFGAPRDGGARDHHGIDIFAPRGTPALAAAAGFVSRVRETARGGRVVWIRDERRGLRLYYAHLDRQLVQPGDRVEVGDTVGLVGNTGNARGTPPHLHFGIYQSGPVDPRPFVAHISAGPARLSADTVLIGGWARLDDETPVRVLAARGNLVRVVLPNGTAREVESGSVVPLEVLATIRTARPAALLGEPAPHGALIDTVAQRDLAVLGRFAGFVLVRADTVIGWVPQRSLIAD